MYKVPIAATDNGGRMAYTTVHVNVLDQNDNVPQFLAKVYELTIVNIMPVNSTLLKVLYFPFSKKFFVCKF